MSTKDVPYRFLRFKMKDVVGPYAVIRPQALPLTRSPFSARGGYEAGIPGGNTSGAVKKFEAAAVALTPFWASYGCAGIVGIELPAEIVGPNNIVEIRFYRDDGAGHADPVDPLYVNSLPNQKLLRGHVIVMDSQPELSLVTMLYGVLADIFAAAGITQWFSLGTSKLGSKKGYLWYNNTLSRWGIFSPAGWARLHAYQQFFNTAGNVAADVGDAGAVLTDSLLRGMVSVSVGEARRVVVLPPSTGAWKRY
jgi:hypothetical protein